MKGSTNPLTDVMTKAEAIVQERWAKLLQEYGLPLYVTDEGKSPKQTWPADPDAMAPEEMARLIETRGEDAVNAWLAEHFTQRAERLALKGED